MTSSVTGSLRRCGFYFSLFGNLRQLFYLFLLYFAKVPAARETAVCSSLRKVRDDAMVMSCYGGDEADEVRAAGLMKRRDDFGAVLLRCDEPEECTSPGCAAGFADSNFS